MVDKEYWAKWREALITWLVLSIAGWAAVMFMTVVGLALLS